MSNYNAEHGIPSGDRDETPESQADCITRLEGEVRTLKYANENLTIVRDRVQKALESFVPFANKLVEEHSDGTIDLKDWSEAMDFLNTMEFESTSFEMPKREVTLTANVVVTAEVEITVEIGMFDDASDIDEDNYYAEFRDAFDEMGNWNQEFEVEITGMSE